MAVADDRPDRIEGFGGLVGVGREGPSGRSEQQCQQPGRGNPSKYASRREELLTSLERVYGSLEAGDGPGPGDRPGIAA